MMAEPFLVALAELDREREKVATLTEALDRERQRADRAEADVDRLRLQIGRDQAP